jgi:signal transduction histidine kinase
VTRYLIISSFLNFLAAGILAFAVVVRGRKDSINVSFGVFALMIGCWSACYCLWQISAEAARALFFCRLLMVFAYFVPISFLRFVSKLCGEDRAGWVRIGYVISSVFVVLNFTPLMVARVETIRAFAFWPVAGRLYWLYLVFFAVVTLYAAWLLLKNLRTATGGRATQLRSIFIASIIGFGGGATNFPLWYGISVPPLGNPLVFLYLLIMAHAASRYQLPLVTYDFVHAAVYIGFSVTLAVAYVFGLTLAAPLFDYELTSERMLTHFLLCVMVALFFIWAVPRLSRAVNRLLAQTFLRRRNTQQLQLKALGHRIVALGSEQEIFENIVREIGPAFSLEATAVYARTEFESDYQLRAAQGWPDAPRSLPNGSVLVRVLQHRMDPVLLDGSEGEMDHKDLTEIDQLRTKMPFEAFFPIASDDFLSGILVLGRREESERYTEAELALLESTCLQIAVNLRARQLERRASQTEKLISLGTLAAGLAHELRNPLVSIQTFAALLRERGTELDFQQEFSAVVQRDVSRIASIVENVASFAESNRVQMSAVSLFEVLTAAAEIARPELQRAKVELVLPVAEAPRVTANYSQLLQVFLNLVQNAAQAMDGRPDSRLAIGFDLQEGTPDPLLCVSVSDNGPGIEPSLLPHIFDPFTTTKSTGERRGKHGMGLGLAIVKRIVQHHHGDIQVSSVVGQGTTFRVYLPPAF